MKLADNLRAAALPATMRGDAERNKEAGNGSDRAGDGEASKDDHRGMLEDRELGFGRHTEKAVTQSVQHTEHVAGDDVVAHPTQPYAITRRGTTAARLYMPEDDPE